MKVLYIGGTGEISLACVEEASRSGHEVTVFNRGQRLELLPKNVELIQGDLQDDRAYQQLLKGNFDVICQFLAFDVDTIQRDIDLFSGHCQQYIFISTASAYQKPCPSHMITEQTPLGNPFWLYSRKKAACEEHLDEAINDVSLPVTIVRPSHTYRTRLPSTVIDGDHLWWRMLNNKPILVHGDGESLWTLTHATDFARAFVALCGNDQALDQTFHITDSEAHTWNNIIAKVAKLSNTTPTITHVASRTLADYNPDWTGPLLGDKSNSMMFDNRKVSGITDNWTCEISLEEGLTRVKAYVLQRMGSDYRPNEKLDALIDHIIDRQMSTNI